MEHKAGTNKASPILKLERQEKIVEGLRLNKSVREIAHDMDISKTSVNNYWREMAKERQERLADEFDILVAVELLKYDKAEKRLEAEMKRGDTRAIEASIKVSRERRKMLGLDKAVKTEVKLDVIDINVGVPKELEDI